MTTARIKPPTTRTGLTHKLQVGGVTLYLTVNPGADGNPIEIFGRADEGYQSEVDGLCILASLALQHGCPVETLVKHLRYRRYPPHGAPGQPCSLSDAVGLALMATLRVEGSAVARTLDANVRQEVG